MFTEAFELRVSKPPGRVKTISAFQLAARLAMSLVIPRARPVKRITRTTPRATPITLMSVRNGRTLRFARTSSSILADVGLIAAVDAHELPGDETNDGSKDQYRPCSDRRIVPPLQLAACRAEDCADRKPEG